ncbi:MAG: hypothetical protein ACKO5K_00040 [Armatimonadota bacterium]
MNRRRRIVGVTLLELLVALGLSTLLLMALGYAFTTGLGFERSREERRRADLRIDRLEEAFGAWIEGAVLGDAEDTSGSTYFVGTSESGDETLGADQLVLTTTGPPPSLTDRADTADFESRNQSNGAVGGVAEASIATTPVGSTDRTGLFLRTQRPADTDPDQGGTESVLDPNVIAVGFAFHDGTTWTNTWDTRSMTPPRLPSTVRVRYRLTGEEESTFHEVLVPIPRSDVDSANPVSQGGTQ